jgi:two-component system, NarL family, response regulator LiaR
MKEIEMNALKVVTVDDSKDERGRMQSVLQYFGYVGFLGNAKNVDEAIHIIRNESPDVVIVEIDAPAGEIEYSGFDSIEILRGMFPEIKLIVYTDVPELSHRLVCMAKGANFFFNKSNGFHGIAQTLKSMQEQN